MLFFEQHDNWEYNFLRSAVCCRIFFFCQHTYLNCHSSFSLSSIFYLLYSTLIIVNELIPTSFVFQKFNKVIPRIPGEERAFTVPIKSPTISKKMDLGEFMALNVLENFLQMSVIWQKFILISLLPSITCYPLILIFSTVAPKRLVLLLLIQFLVFITTSSLSTKIELASFHILIPSSALTFFIFVLSLCYSSTEA